VDQKPYLIRDAIGEDINFIYATWLQSYRNDSFTGGASRKSVFYEFYNPVLDHLLSKSFVKVAALHDEPAVILAYCCFESGGILHYVYVKEAFRRMGIARELVTLAAPKFYTHQTRSSKEAALKMLNVDYNPYLLYTRGAI
jgi:GNAT superfamily N-acetyltransferase